MKTREKGQIVVILALAMVAIVAVTALAVDGSSIYRERRADQAMADSLALTAANTAATSTPCSTARTVAINKAINFASTQQGLTLANDSTSPNRVEATCSADNKSLDIKITVTTVAPTTFARMVARNQLTTTVNSTSRITFGTGVFANGSALWSTGPTCDANGGIWLDGTAIIKITGGGAYSKSCISVKTSPSGILSDSAPIYYSGTTGNNVTTAYVGSQIEYLGVAGQFGSNGLMLASWQKAFVLQEPTLVLPKDIYQYQVNPNPNTLIPVLKWPIPIPLQPSPVFGEVMAQQTCAGLTDRGTPPATTTVYNPGLYTSMFIDSNSGATLNPGVYCIKPGGSVQFDEANNTANDTIFYFQGAGSFKLYGGVDKVTMNNSSIYLTNGDFDVDQGIFYSDSITIYIKQGSFYLRNGAYGATIKAPMCSTSACGVGPAIKGVLLFMDPANTGTFNIKNGNGAHYLAGTIYAPNALAYFDGGTATNSIDIQLIAKRIDLSGSASITLDTNNGDLYAGGGSTKIELLK